MDNEMRLWWCAECHKVGIVLVKSDAVSAQKTAVVSSHKEKSPTCQKPPFSLNLTEIVAKETPDWVSQELVKTLRLH